MGAALGPRPLLLGAALLLAPAARPARAAGIETPDLGALGLGRAGAMAARPEHSLAHRFNPAGFAHQRGLRGDLQGLISWQRMRFDPGNGSYALNTALPFAAPNAAGVSLGLGPRGPLQDLTFALGVVAPSGTAGALRYGAHGPQRYSIVANQLLVAMPSLSVAVGLWPWLSVGVAAQLAFSQIQVDVAARLTAGTDRAADAAAHIAVQGGPQPTGVVGIIFTPLPQLAIGASFRPPLGVRAAGSLTAQLPAALAELHITEISEAVTAQLTLAPALRLGVQYRPVPRWEVEVDYVWEGWSAFESIDIAMAAPTVTTTGGVVHALPPVSLPQHFVDAHGVHAAVETRIPGDVLALRAGLALETSAVPVASTSLMFPNWGTQMITCGASVTLFGIHLDVAYGHGFTPRRTVTHSIGRQVVLAGLVFPNAPAGQPLTVGNGTYQSDLDIIAVGLGFALETFWQAPDAADAPPVTPAAAAPSAGRPPAPRQPWAHPGPTGHPAMLPRAAPAPRPRPSPRAGRDGKRGPQPAVR